jgi:hypothetical protein
VTADAEPGVISIGLTRGISLTVFQSSQTTTHMRMKKQTGSHVSAKFETALLKSKPSAAVDGLGSGTSYVTSTGTSFDGSDDSIHSFPSAASRRT